MTRIILALGSNIQQRYHMEQANALLCDTFRNVSFTEACWTKPIGLDSDDFLNEMVAAYTDLSLENLLTLIKSIEETCGRSQDDSELGLISMDIDLMQYADQRFHEKDWERPYIKKLIEQLNLE